MKIGFIGLGNMATAMIGGMLQKGIAAPEDIIGSARTETTVEKVKTKFNINTTTDNKIVAAQADILFLAVKPIFFPEVIDQIKDVVAEDTLIVSIAAGRTLDYLKEAFGRSELKLIRCMPNTPALVLEGCTGVCAEENVTEEDMEQVLALLRSFGIASVVPERLMDVVVGVSGSSPAYVFMFIEAMADEAVAAGMPRKQAYEFAGTIRPWQCQDGAGDRQTSRRTEGHGVLPRWNHDPGSQGTGGKRHARRCHGCHGCLH